MNSDQLAKVKAVLAKHGLSEQRLSRGIYMKEDGSRISADLRGEKPIIGMMINDTVQPDGNSNAEIIQMQNEVEAIMKSKTIPTPRSSVSDLSAPPKAEAKGSNPASGGIDKGTQSRQMSEPTKPIPSESKLGAGDTPTKIPMCRKCGIEVSHARALACLGNDEPCTCEECGEKQTGENKISTESFKIPELKEKIMDEKLPAKKEEAKPPAKKTDAEIDAMIEKAKAEKFLKGQGGSYNVSGKNRPDSAMVQKFANEADISTEILFAEQTKEYAHVIVRGHRGTRYIDEVVHHDFETEFQLQTMEIIKKNPQILDHYEGLIPVIKDGATVTVGYGEKETKVDAKYYLIHALLTFKTFSIRDATTKAMNRAQLKLLNQDAREPEEVASEQKERKLVEETRNQKR